MHPLNPDHRVITFPAPLPMDSSTNIGTASKAFQYILVMVPNLDIDLSHPVQKLWEQARTTGAHIHFISGYNDPTEEPGLRRGLAMLSTMVQEKGITTSIETPSNKHWHNVLNRLAPDIDLVMYFPESRTGSPDRLFKQALPADLNAPLHIFSDTAQEERSSGIQNHVIAWVSSFLILAGFFLIQARITQISQDWFQTLLLVLTVLPEFWLILWVNSSF